MQFLTMRQVCAMFVVVRATIKRWQKNLSFPLAVQLGEVKPIKLRHGHTRRSNCAIRFNAEEVYTWAQRRMEARLPPEEVE